MVAAYELIYLFEWRYHGESTLRARQISPGPPCVSFSRFYGRIIDTRDRRENVTRGIKYSRGGVKMRGALPLFLVSVKDGVSR